MVYNQKFVVVVKSKGRVLRERGETVYIPFGSEYSILLKNLNSRDAVVKVSVDGSDVLDGNELIVRANKETELQGFMRRTKGTHKFRFIEKTDEISDYRGDKPDDGLIRVSFRFEKDVVEMPEIYWPTSIYYNNNRSPSIGGPYDVYGSGLTSQSQVYSNCVGTRDVFNEDGITVKGSKSNQQFVEGSVGTLEATEHVVVLQLRGKIEKNIIRKPVEVKTKITCEVCGKKSRSSSKFCWNCSNALF